MNPSATTRQPIDPTTARHDLNGMLLACAVESAICTEIGFPSGSDEAQGLFSYGVGFMGVEPRFVATQMGGRNADHYILAVQYSNAMLDKPILREVAVLVDTVETLGLETITDHLTKKKFCYLFSGPMPLA